jgi:hypothetical protein
VCGGGVCVGGGGRAFYYTYIYSKKGQSCEGAELVGVLVAETIHPAFVIITAVPTTKLFAWGGRGSGGHVP